MKEYEVAIAKAVEELVLKGCAHGAAMGLGEDIRYRKT
jgi:hypothetical protein